MAYNETDIINAVAAQERAIAGVKASYDFARNPDRLNAAELPAALHFAPRFTAQRRAHFNVWDNTVTVQTLLFVRSREAAGGKLRYLDNEAVPYGQLWRARFQDETVLRALAAATGAVRFFLTGGEYGAGRALTLGDVEYIGWTFTFDFSSA